MLFRGNGLCMFVSCVCKCYPVGYMYHVQVCVVKFSRREQFFTPLVCVTAVRLESRGGGRIGFLQTTDCRQLLPSLNILNDGYENRALALKLPHSTANQWARKVAHLREESRYPSLGEFRSSSPRRPGFSAIHYRKL